uniref:Uncharacterized protein n=1 Tax=Knipowitschia caucasica TaxID=637954 RepID=A0AAV2LB42_KNICA
MAGEPRWTQQRFFRRKNTSRSCLPSSPFLQGGKAEQKATVEPCGSGHDRAQSVWEREGKEEWDVMDDEDDRQLLDILGDVDALNDYLHGSNSKSIGEEDVNNAAYGSDSSFFSSDTVRL